MHHKTRTIPVGQIVTGIVLMVLAAIVAIAAILSVQDPAAASAAWQARSAAMLARDATHARPYWDGRHPRTWVGQDPMCEARYHGRHGWAKADRNGPRFRVECLPDGPGQYAWGIRITPAEEVSSYTAYLTTGYGASMGINPSALPADY